MFSWLRDIFYSLLIIFTSFLSLYVKNIHLPVSLPTISQPVSNKQQLLLKTPLKFGDTGNDVIILQAVLASDNTIYPEALVSGYYGEITRRAVTNFQKRYKLEPTGNLDQPSLNKFNKVYSIKPLSYYLSLIPTSPPNAPTPPQNQLININNEDWGKVKQISEHTYTTRLGMDARMGTAQEIFVAQNIFRQNNGKPPLTWDDNLARWAQERAQTFADIDNVDEHAGFSAQAQQKAQEYRYRIVGENSFYGGRLEATHLIEWTFAQDIPHKENMLGDWTNVGIGVATRDGINYGVDIIFGNEKY